jgi:serine/threonine protein kinase
MFQFSRLWKGNARTAGASSPTSSTPSSAQSPFSEELTAGSVVGRCLLLRQLGEGASGRVFQAHHKTLNISVALKLLKPERVNDPRVHNQLQHEAQLLARLNHPHIVRVWDFEDDPVRPYIVLEYIEGPTLADLIEQSGRLAPDRVLTLMREVARGLNAAWKLGIIHRDLKPANVLLTKNGEAKLSDLGLAVILGSPPDPARPVAAGTPLYAAPEQCFAPAKVDQRSDLYSLGATFYHALTGEPPFTGATVSEVMHRHSCEMPIPPHQRVPGIPEPLSAIILRLLAKEPAHRYADYDDLLNILDSQAGSRDSDRQRSRQTVVAPRSTIEEALRTQAYLGPEQSPVGEAKPPAGKHGKETIVARRITIPEEAPAPPRAPSETAQQMDRSQQPPGTDPSQSPAAPELRPELDLTPTEASIVGLKLTEAIAASRAGRSTEAAVLLRQVTQDEPENDLAWLWLARSIAPGAEAVGIYRNLLERRPDDVMARQGLLGARLAAAAADARVGNRDAARASFRKLTEEYPELEEAWVGLARLAETPAEADKIWRAVLRMNPGRVEARLALARRSRR